MRQKVFHQFEKRVGVRFAQINGILRVVFEKIVDTEAVVGQRAYGGNCEKFGWLAVNSFIELTIYSRMQRKLFY